MDRDVLGVGSRRRGGEFGCDSRYAGDAARRASGRRSTVRSSVDGSAHRSGVRPLPALLVALLIAALCPFVAASPAGAASSFVELPEGFTPRKINNNGQIAGGYFDATGAGLAIWADGNLQKFPMTESIPWILDFSESGEILYQRNNQLMVTSAEGTTTYPKAVVAGDEQNMFSGFGPRHDDSIVGIHPWESETETNAVVYKGSSPPTVVTQLSTVSAANHTGEMFGELPGTERQYAMLKNGVATPVGGFVTDSVWPADFANGGEYMLYAANGGYHLWHNGTSVALETGAFVPRVNSSGVVTMSPPGPNGEFGIASVRFPDGRISTIRSLVGGAPGWDKMYGDSDINDECWAIGTGTVKQADGTSKGAGYLAKIDGCNPVDLEGEFFRVDGGSAYVKIGDAGDVRLRVENAGSERIMNVSVTSAEVVSDETDENAGAAELTGAGTLTSTTLDATGPGSVAFADFVLKGTKEGPVTLRAEVAGNRGGQTVTGTIEREFEVRGTPLLVEVIPPEEPVQLEVREDGDRDENGQLIDPSYIAQEVPMKVRLTVAEDSDPLVEIKPFETVEGDGGIDLDLVRRQGDQFFDVVPQPVPFPASWVGPMPPGPGEDDEPLPPGEEPAFPIERMEPGESVELDLLVTVENPGTFEVSSFFEALTEPDQGPQKAVRSIGNGILPVGGDAVLSVEIHADRDQGSPPRIDEGGRAQFTGTVKNLSLTDTIQLSPVRAISLGQGRIVGPVELTEPFPAEGEIGFFEPRLEPGPGEQSEATFKVAVDTTSLPGVGWELLSGRESVILDLAIKGTVIDPEGAEREIDPQTDVTLDVGNGRWTNGLRVEVDPQLNPQPLIEADQILWALYGETAESVAQAGYNFFASIPGMIKSMPTVLAALGSGAVNLASATAEAELLAVQYAWTWAEYQAQVVLAMNPEEKQAELDAIAADLAHLYDEDLAPVAAAVNQAVEGFFTSMLAYKGRADAAGARGDVKALIEQTGETVEVVSQVVMEEVSGQAVMQWIAKAARSERATLALARAREKLNVEEVRKLEAATDEMRAAQANPKVQQASPALKGVSPGTPVSSVQAIRGWAIDRISDANLRMLTKKRPIMVAMRSRADETLEWMQTRLGMTPKPVTVKPKNVNLDDCNFLGYRCGEIGYSADGSRSLGDRGSVAMREPITRPEVIRRLDAAGVDDLTRERVLKRHDQRWDEWYGEPCPYTRVACAAPDPPLESKWTKMKKATPIRDFSADGLEVRRGKLEVPRAKHPPETADNFDTGGSAADGVYEERAFELREVKLDDGASSWEVWLEDSDGVLKRVSGDMDAVSVTYSDGRSFEPNSDYAREVALDLQEAVDAQHPWSSSLTNPKLRKKFLNDHLWDPDPLKRGEPLLIYTGGEARIGYFDPDKVADMVAGTDTDPLGAVIWLEGGPNNIDAAVKRQIDLRQQIIDPLSQPTPQGHVTAETKVRSALLRANQEARAARNAVEIQKTADRYATCAINASRNVKAPVAVWRMSDRLQQRQPDGTWEDADPGEDCDDGELVIFPETAITEPVSAGATVLPILEELLGFDWLDMFRIGDCITIDAGMPNEESACITDHGSLVLDRPLQFDHDRFARVVMDTPGGDPGDGDPGDGSGDGSGGGSGGTGEPGDGSGTPAGNPGGPGAAGTDGTGGASGTPPGASPISYTAAPPPPASAASGSGSGQATSRSGSGGGPLAFTGTGSRRVIYLGSLLVLVGLAFLAAGDRRRRNTFLVHHRRGRI